MGKIFLTEISVSVINGRLIKQKIDNQESLENNLYKSEQKIESEEILSKCLIESVSSAYDMFINEYPECSANIIITLNYFIKKYQGINDDITHISYIQIEVQYEKHNNRSVENCYINSNEDCPKIIFDLLCSMELYNQRHLSIIKSHYLGEKIIFRNKAAALLIHEFSHLFEADIYLYSRNYIKEINPNIVLDDLFYHPSLPEICLNVDDEFSLNQNITILEKGVVKNILVDKKWAQIYHSIPKGNGRRDFKKDAPVFPRMRISHMKYLSEFLMDKEMINNVYIVIDNIKNGKLFPKNGMVVFQVETAEYHSHGNVIHIQPFAFQCSIIELMNNIIGVSKSNYHAVYPCGKNGYQLPCGVIVPSNILTIGGNIYVL